MLIVDRQSWHAKIYRWWYEAKYDSKYQGDTTNLCPYIRAVLIWAPFWFLFGPQWKIGKFYVSFVTVPAAWIGVAKLIGYVSYSLKVIAFGVFGVLGIVAVPLLFLFWLENNEIPEKVIDKVSGMSFANLLTEYARSAHDQICPPVEFK